MDTFKAPFQWLYLLGKVVEGLGRTGIIGAVLKQDDWKPSKKWPFGDDVGSVDSPLHMALTDGTDAPRT